MKTNKIKADAPEHPIVKNCNPNITISAVQGMNEEAMTDAMLSMALGSSLNDAQQLSAMIGALVLKYCSIEHGDERSDLEFLFSCVKESFDRYRTFFEFIDRLCDSGMDPTELEYEDLQEMLADLDGPEDEEDNCCDDLEDIPDEMLEEILSAVISDFIESILEGHNTTECGCCCNKCTSEQIPRYVCVKGKVVRTNGGL